MEQLIAEHQRHTAAMGGDVPECFQKGMTAMRSICELAQKTWDEKSRTDPAFSRRAMDLYRKELVEQLVLSSVCLSSRRGRAVVDVDDR